MAELNLTYEKAIETLVLRFPELRMAVEQDSCPDLPHIIFENVFAPYIIKAAGDRTDKMNRDRLHESLIFLEEMACSIDDKVKNLAEVAVIESLLANSKEFREPYTLFKPKSAILAKKASKLFKFGQ